VGSFLLLCRAGLRPLRHVGTVPADARRALHHLESGDLPDRHALPAVLARTTR